MSGGTVTDFFITVSTIASHVGICLILFFLGLILFSKKNRTVEGYFSAVASNSILDLIFSILVAIVKMDCFYKDGFFVFAMHRFDYELDPVLNKILIMACVFMAHTCFYVVSIPFYIRYMLICKKQNVNYGMRILLYLFGISCGVGTFSLFYMVFYSSPPELVEYQMKPYLKGNENGRYWNFAGAKIVSWRILLSLVIYIILHCFAKSVI